MEDIRSLYRVINNLSILYAKSTNEHEMEVILQDIQTLHDVINSHKTLGAIFGRVGELCDPNTCIDT